MSANFLAVISAQAGAQWHQCQVEMLLSTFRFLCRRTRVYLSSKKPGRRKPSRRQTHKASEAKSANLDRSPRLSVICAECAQCLKRSTAYVRPDVVSVR